MSSIDQSPPAVGVKRKLTEVVSSGAAPPSRVTAGEGCQAPPAEIVS